MNVTVTGLLAVTFSHNTKIDYSYCLKLTPVHSWSVNASGPLKLCLWNVNKQHEERGQPPNEGRRGTRKNKWLTERSSNGDKGQR